MQHACYVSQKFGFSIYMLHAFLKNQINLLSKEQYKYNNISTI